MKRSWTLIALLLILLLASTPVRAQSTPVVRAVLFYSPDCGHCQLVINDTILPLTQKYGDSLQVLSLDVTSEQNWNYFVETVKFFGLESAGVPFLLIDDTYLYGSEDIPARFPGMLADYLEQGGVGWPRVPGLEPFLPEGEVPSEVMSSPASDLASRGQLTLGERFALDPAGNALAVVVLLAMLGACIWVWFLFRNEEGLSLQGDWSWGIPILCLLGLGVAGYLAYVETQQVEAVCGPVGDCNTVQQSEYARLFGVLPIGVLGLIGYLFMLGAWGIARYGRARFADLSALFLFGMAVFGVLFSIYLTFLEPFVIGATCAWCLTSALLMTVLLVLTVRPARLALSNKPFSPSPPPRRKKR